MEPEMMNTGAAGGEAFGMMFMLFMVTIYVYFSFAFVTMAKKLGHEDIAWWGWVPIMNTLLIIKMAEKPGIWFLYLMIPIANFVFFAMLWMEVARKLGKSSLMGFMMLVPFVNFISVGIMAFGKDDGLRRVSPQSGPMSHSPHNVNH